MRQPLSLKLRISPADPVPIYLQIANQVKYQVASGRLVPGDELPPIRVLSEQLVVNPHTVAQAYKSLEMIGIVEKRSTNGTFIAEGLAQLIESERRQILSERVLALLVEAIHLAIPTTDIISMIEHCDATFKERLSSHAQHR